jgi:uncharacterized protein YcbX
MVTVSGLFIYPVKSLGGISLESTALCERGLTYDREWMIVDKNNRFISQREIARMSLIGTALNTSANSLDLTLPDGLVLPVPLAKPAADAPYINVQVWDDQVEAIVEHDTTNQALSKYLEVDARLVRMRPKCRRKVDPVYAPEEQDIVGFADGFPILVISQESLEDLNSKLEVPVAMNRFRPNIVTTGSAAYAEDEWRTMSVNGLTLELVKPCARCVIVTVDQELGIAGKEPLRTLANYRRINNKIIFGKNAIFRGSGTLKVGVTAAVL